MSKASHSVSAVAMMMACVAVSAVAQPFTFTRILDSSTVIPNSGGKRFQGDAFSNLSLSQGRLAFEGSGPGIAGVYEWHAGALVRVADTTTPTPNTGNPFEILGMRTTNSGDHVAFLGNDGNIGGLYHRREGVLSAVFDTQTAAPNGGTFFGGGPASIEGDAIAFSSRHTSESGTLPSVYRWDNGVITTVADTSTPVPGGTGTFSASAGGQFNTVHLDTNAVWFRGIDSANKSGIYKRDAGGLAAVLDTTSEGPAGEGTFLGFGDFDVDGDDLLFTSATVGNPVSALYRRVEGEMTRLLNYGDPAPGGGTFYLLRTLTMDDGVAVFGAVDIEIRGGVYTDLGGELQRILGPGSVLDGKTVKTTDFARDGSQLAIHVTFNGHNPSEGLYDEAIYLTIIPGPGAMLPFGAAAALLAARRSR